MRVDLLAAFTTTSNRISPVAGGFSDRRCRPQRCCTRLSLRTAPLFFLAPTALRRFASPPRAPCAHTRSRLPSSRQVLLSHRRRSSRRRTRRCTRGSRAAALGAVGHAVGRAVGAPLLAVSMLVASLPSAAPPLFTPALEQQPTEQSATAGLLLRAPARVVCLCVLSVYTCGLSARRHVFPFVIVFPCGWRVGHAVLWHSLWSVCPCSIVTASIRAMPDRVRSLSSKAM